MLPFDKRRRRQKRLLLLTYSVIGLLFIGILAFFAFTLYSSHETSTTPSSSSSSSKTTHRSSTSVSSSSTSSSSSEAEEVTEAKNTLERQYSVLSDDETKDVKSSLSTAMEYLDSIKDDSSSMNLTIDNYLSITDKTSAQTILTMLHASYVFDADSVQVFKSNSEGVYQFVFEMKKASDNTEIAVTGNYVVNTKQIELVNVFGVPTGIMN